MTRPHMESHVQEYGDPLPVRVTNLPAPEPRPERTSTAKTVVLQGNTGAVQSHLLAAHSPRRKQVTISIIGQSTDVVWLCNSAGDAKNLQGAAVMGGMVLTLNGTDAWYVGAAAATAIIIGVIPEVV